MDDPLAQLKDIEGLDLISWWPPAIGWWIVIAVILLLIFGFSIRTIRKHAFQRSWRNSVLKQLTSMEYGLDESTGQKTATDLSELIRRIAINQYGRNQCAGLYGKQWLAWLKQHDPKYFDWEQQGQLLLDAPYAPEGKQFSPAQVKVLIEATKEWVK